jgi:hypothetical protein
MLNSRCDRASLPSIGMPIVGNAAEVHKQARPNQPSFTSCCYVLLQAETYVLAGSTPRTSKAASILRRNSISSRLDIMSTP